VDAVSPTPCLSRLRDPADPSPSPSSPHPAELVSQSVMSQRASSSSLVSAMHGDSPGVTPRPRSTTQWPLSRHLG
jgi:hypothetical protein